jgi:hypothetical protein
MDVALLIGQAEHGPQLHGGIVPVIVVAIALLAGLGVLVRRARHEARKGGDRDPERDPGPDA